MSEVKKCAKCGGKLVNEGLEWECQNCGFSICTEPEYCLPKEKDIKRKNELCQ